MSSSLYWKPPEPEGRTLGDDLKFVLRRYFDSGYMSEWQSLRKGNDVAFLRGVMAMSTDRSLDEDIMFLIKQIEKYGSVDVRERS